MSVWLSFLYNNDLQLINYEMNVYEKISKHISFKYVKFSLQNRKFY